MRKKLVATLFLGLLTSGWASPVPAGDSLYGKVIEVKSAEVIVLDYGAGQYDIHLVGIIVPRGRESTDRARQFVSDLLLGKNVRMRFEGRTANGEMMARLLTDDPVIGIKDVGAELLRAGMARRQPRYDYKYRELSAAENEARRANRGLWVSPRRR